MFNLSVADGFKVNAHWKIFYACPSLSQTTCTPAETSIYRMICAQNGTSNRKYILQTLRPEVNMDILVVFENNGDNNTTTFIEDHSHRTKATRTTSFGDSNLSQLDIQLPSRY